MGEQNTKAQKTVSQPEPLEESEERSTADYAKFEPPKKFTGKKRLAVIIVLLFLLLAATGTASYWFVLRGKPATTSTTGSKSTQTARSSSAASKITTATKSHDSSSFRLQFNYPADWTVAEAEAGGQLTVKSPAMVLKDTDNQTVTGQIVFTIRDKQQALPEFDSGNAVAARPSEKIAYVKPAPGQRANTYLSFLRYMDSANGLDGIYVTGDTGYTLNQAIPKADFVPIEPVVSLTFFRCDGNCSGDNLAISITPTSWDDKDFSNPLKALLQSLVIH